MRGRRTLGSLAAAVALALLAASLWLPWLAVRSLSPGPYRDVDRAELVAQGPIPYELVLLHAPLVACIAVALAGVAVAFVGHRWVREATTWTCAAAGLALAACGTRWLGFYIARLWDPGPSLAHLHLVPWLQLALGLALLAAAGPPAWRGLTGRNASGTWWRDPARNLLVLGLAGVLATPLLPHAVLRRPQTFHYDELTLAAVGATGGAAANDAALALTVLRLLGGLLLALAVASAWAQRKELLWTAPAFGFAAMAVGLSLLVVSGMLLLRLRDLPSDPRLGPNLLFPVLGAGALAAGAAMLVRAVRGRAPVPSSVG